MSSRSKHPGPLEELELELADFKSSPHIPTGRVRQSKVGITFSIPAKTVVAFDELATRCSKSRNEAVEEAIDLWIETWPARMEAENKRRLAEYKRSPRRKS